MEIGVLGRHPVRISLTKKKKKKSNYHASFFIINFVSDALCVLPSKSDFSFVTIKLTEMIRMILNWG